MKIKKPIIYAGIFAFIALLLLSISFGKFIKNEPVFDTDRCLKLPNTHCEVARIPNGTVNVTVNSTNDTYYYNYTY